MSWLVLLAAVPSFAVTLACVPLVRKLCVATGLVDHPDDRKGHAQPTPLGGGIAIWIGIVVTLVGGEAYVRVLTAGAPAAAQEKLTAVAGDSIAQFAAPHLAGWQEQSPQLWRLIAAGTLLMVLGLADDRWGLPWKLRLAVQILVAAFAVWQGWQLTVFIDWQVLTGLLSVLWIVGLVNSFNMLDNMDGLSGGVAMIGGAILAVTLLLAPDPETQGPQLFVAGLLAVLTGSLAGFLVYNAPPASIFMGDAGSYWIGFLLGTTTMMATFAGENLPRHAVLAPLAVMAVPIYDTLTVLAIRWRAGRSLFQSDNSHLSHRLVSIGFSRRLAVVTIYLMSATCGLGALLLHQVDGLGAGIVLAMVACILLLIAIIEAVAASRGPAAR